MPRCDPWSRSGTGRRLGAIRKWEGSFTKALLVDLCLSCGCVERRSRAGPVHDVVLVQAVAERMTWYSCEWLARTARCVRAFRGKTAYGIYP